MRALSLGFLLLVYSSAILAPAGNPVGLAGAVWVVTPLRVHRHRCDVLLEPFLHRHRGPYRDFVVPHVSLRDVPQTSSEG